MTNVKFSVKTEEKTKTISKEKIDLKKEFEKILMLHNDESNTFEWVIISLKDVCDIPEAQGEQIAQIVHTKGKCDVKRGSADILKPLKMELQIRGLSVTIEDGIN
jgi:ATP-dependent Clp protease adaptor protein ClpS